MDEFRVTSPFQAHLENCKTPVELAPFISHVCAHEMSEELLHGFAL
jgi:hypothetical protein